MSISPQQCRAGRILAEIDLRTLAEASGLLVSRLDGFEAGRTSLSEAECRALCKALDGLGAVMIPEDEWGGPGVRLRFASDQAKRIGTWENEGGMPADDDIAS